MHGLRVCPDLDSVTYWLGDAFDRERGWGRRDETFRATEELRPFDADAAWFGLGDLDLATHLFRTRSLAEGGPLSAVTAPDRRAVRDRRRRSCRCPTSGSRRGSTWCASGEQLDLHFQEYWVRRGARDDVKAIRFEGAEGASPAPGVLDAIEDGGRRRDLPLEPGRVDRADPGGPAAPGGRGRAGRWSGSPRSSAGGRSPAWPTG